MKGPSEKSSGSIFFKKNFQKKKSDTYRNGGVRQIKNRPDSEIEKVNDRTHADPVNPVAGGSSQNEPNAPLRSEIGGL